MKILLIQKTLIFYSLSNPALFTSLQTFMLLKGCPIASLLSFSQNSVDWKSVDFKLGSGVWVSKTSSSAFPVPHQNSV